MLRSLQSGMHGAAWVCEMAEGVFIPTSRREKAKSKKPPTSKYVHCMLRNSL